MLFSAYLTQAQHTVAGFSYGAQKAFEYVYHTKERIERLTLLSPAFFQTQKESFSRTQLHYFSSDHQAYVAQFLKNVASPSATELTRYLKQGSKEELEALLSYRWDQTKIEEVLQRGTTIEVFLGEKDKIIQVEDAYAFFSHLTTTYFIKDAGHLLQEKSHTKVTLR
jgi:pimeloyl-ACP methyl ester carboxylesterase